MSSNNSSDGSTLTSSGNLTTFVIPGMNSMRIAVLLHHGIYHRQPADATRK
jgi:hypothetical protein